MNEYGKLVSYQYIELYFAIFVARKDNGEFFKWKNITCESSSTHLMLNEIDLNDLLWNPVDLNYFFQEYHSNQREERRKHFIRGPC